MAYHPTSGRDPSLPVSAGASGVSSQPGDRSIPEPNRHSDLEPGAQPLPETDLADLRARFAASNGSGLSGELSSELALEIVLHEIMEQACLATGATGAAIVLEQNGQMVCRASSGPTAPGLGARLDIGSGLSGECVRTRQVQRCDDALVDPRADGEASRRLGVRSVMVFPLLREEKVLGIFEAFSSRPAAFGERDERTLEALASRILKNMVSAAQPLVEQQSAASNEGDVTASEFGEAVLAEPSQRALDFVTWALAVVVLMCAVWVGARVVQHFRPQAGVQSVKEKVQSADVSGAGQGKVGVGSQASPVSGTTSAMARAPNAAPDAGRAKETSSGASAISSGKSAPEGSLLVYENGKEVFRMPPVGSQQGVSQTEQTGVRRAASVEPAMPTEKVMELTPAAAESSLTHRVEPEYPEQARQERIEGAVVLDARIRPDGAIEELKVVRGQPVLAGAAIAAVKQWRFRQHQVNGKPAAMQTTITLNFRLPK